MSLRIVLNDTDISLLNSLRSIFSVELNDVDILNHFERCRNRTRIMDFFNIFKISNFSKIQLTGAKKHPKRGQNYATSQSLYLIH